MRQAAQRRASTIRPAGSTIAAGALFLLSLGTAAPAAADCMVACLAEHGCRMERNDNGVLYSDGPQCLMYQNSCNAQCPHETATARADQTATLSAPAQNSGSFGAIAHDIKSGAWGASKPAVDQASAAQDALNFCRPHGPNCAVIAVVHKACVAIATGNNNIMTWVKASTIAKARRKAQSACIKESNDSCAIAFAACYPP